MKPLTLRLRRAPPHPIDVSPLTAGGRVREPGALAAVKLRIGRQRVRTDAIFAISGEDPAQLRLLRASDRLLGIGTELETGAIEVNGDAGDYLGHQLAGGSIRVKGSAGRWLGAGMRGGRIIVTGNAGDFVGAALPGEQQGMSEGLIHIHGHAGDRLGDRMRRGAIIVDGDVGDYCGSRMLAGTIIVLGRAGRHSGFDMRRGTIVLSQMPKGTGANFNNCGAMKMEILRVLFRQLGAHCPSLEALEKGGPLAIRYAGDLALGGRGEMLVVGAAAQRASR